MTTTHDVVTQAPASPVLRPERLRPALVLSTLAALAATIAAAASLLRPGLLHGAAVTDGNLRGTALIVLVVGVPLVLGALSHPESAHAPTVWLAGLVYLDYQAVLFCFATPMNRLFPAYVATLGLAGWASAAVVRAVDIDAVTARLGRASRVVPAALGVVATLNALAWLARAVPITWTGEPPAAVADSGLATSPVLVEDLALWLPLALLVSVLAWRGVRWASLLSSSLLLFYAVEALSVASDQWWGVRADDTRPAVAAIGAVPGALGAAVVLGLLSVWDLTRTRSRS